MIKFLANLFPFSYLFFYPTSITSSIWLSMGLISIILATFFYGLIKLYIETNNFNIQINNALLILKNLKLNEIHDKYEEIDNKVLKIEIIANVWREFSETLLKIPEKDGKIRVYNIVNSNAFFNEVNLTEKININLYKSIPSILTGLGIMGTFIGIMYGLSKIDLGTSNISHLKSGIEHLLGGADTAFATSIWGIGTSILFIILKKSRLNRISNKILQLQNSIDKLFIQKKAEHFLMDILYENKQQTAEIKSFKSDIIIAIANGIDQLADDIRNLDSSIKGLQQEITVLLEKQIKEITSANSENFKNLKELLEELKESGSKTIIEALKTTTKSEMNSFKELLIMLNKNISNISTSLEDHAELFKENYNQFKNLLVHLNDILEKSGTIWERSNSCLEQYQEFFDILNNQVDYFRIIIDKFEKINEKLETTVEHSNNTTEKFISSLNQSLTKFIQISDKTKESWEAYDRNFGNIREELDETFEKLKEGLSEYSEILGSNLENVLKKFDNYLGEGVNKLSQLVGSLQELLIEIQESLETLEDIKR